MVTRQWFRAVSFIWASLFVMLALGTGCARRVPFLHGAGEGSLAAPGPRQSPTEVTPAWPTGSPDPWPTPGMPTPGPTWWDTVPTPTPTPTPAPASSPSGVTTPPPPTSAPTSPRRAPTLAPEPAAQTAPIVVEPALARETRAVNGSAMTWDGRILFRATGATPNPRLGDLDDTRFDNVLGAGTHVSVVVAERLSADARGLPIFSTATGSLASDLLLSVPDDMTADFAAARAAGLNPDPHILATYVPGYGMPLAVAPTRGFSPNPYRSDARGTADPSGDCETYRVDLFTVSNGRDQVLGLRQAMVVVRAPRTPGASLVSAAATTGFVPLSTVTGRSIFGMEPSITGDGHLLLFQGHRAQAHGGMLGEILYTVNTGNGPAGWSDPRPLHFLYAHHHDTLVEGIPLALRYPLARRPLLDPNGLPYAASALFVGAYPWIDPDGRVALLTTVKSAIWGGLRRSGLSAIGSSTHWALVPLDGPVNPSRWGKYLLGDVDPATGVPAVAADSPVIFSSPGWAPYADSGQKVIPYSPTGDVLPLLGAATGSYVEVAFDEDGYAAVYPMNEALVYPATAAGFPDCVDAVGGYARDIVRTPDTSGHFAHGVLHGALFPFEYHGWQPPPMGPYTSLYENQLDRNEGRVGQAIYFGAEAYVEAAHGPGLDSIAAAGSLTAELFIRPLVVPGTARTLLAVDDLFAVSLDAAGRPAAAMRTANGTWVGATAPTALPLDWTHVAVTYDGTSGALRIFLDGTEAIAVATAGRGLSPSRASLRMGPGRSGLGGPAVLQIDEVKLSAFPRGADEVFRHAYRRVVPATPWPSRLAPLPGLAGLASHEPAADPVTPEKVDLGESLFFDARLSKNGDVSCASCHSPAHGFSDPRRFAVGTDGSALSRHAPPVINRVFSSRQMLDARAPSLERQALLPLTAAHEMAMDEATLAARLQADPSYVAQFAAAFAEAPSLAGTARALAAFERTILSGDSPYDRFRAGDSHALGLEAQIGMGLFFGKARCAGCHAGANFTDESLHVRPDEQGDLAIKTPTLRDLAARGPYLHDGSATTLAEVVDRYDAGSLSRGRDAAPLGLSPDEKRALLSFLQSLNGRVTYGRASLR